MLPSTRAPGVDLTVESFRQRGCVPAQHPGAHARYTQHTWGIAESVASSEAVLLLINPIGATASFRPETITAVFKITVAEARLTSALASGRTLGEYAAAAGLSRETVRKEPASVFVKTRQSPGRIGGAGDRRPGSAQRRCRA
jgi:hypothetical protein